MPGLLLHASCIVGDGPTAVNRNFSRAAVHYQTGRVRAILGPLRSNGGGPLMIAQGRAAGFFTSASGERFRPENMTGGGLFHREQNLIQDMWAWEMR